MKTTLTPEQSATLIAKGISADKASEIKEYDDEVSQWTHRGAPIFTLSDILGILPIADRDLGSMNMGFDVERGLWASYYEFFNYIACADEFIDSLYKLLLWVIDKGFIYLTK